MKTDYNNIPRPRADDMDEASTGNTMLENTSPSSTHSRWDDFFLTLKLVGIALAILGAIWGITYFQGG